MKKNIIYILPIVVIALVVLLAFVKKGDNKQYIKSTGFIFGTEYHITYESAENYDEDIKNVLNTVDLSLSTFNKESTITAVNENKATTLDDDFVKVFNEAKKIYKDTNGAFDITVAPLVNAWGFGFKNGAMPTKTQVDSIKTLIGFDKVSLENNKVTKTDKRIMLDCSAIAKGYAVDKVSEFFKSKGVENFMIEIGGEIITRGVNPQKHDWTIGVTKPVDDSLATSQDIQAKLLLNNVAMATSGNYRNFYYKDGKKYAHTIDPKTGYPVQHNILSATVLAPTCAKADAYATAFMVVGLDEAKKILNRNKDLKAYIIYNDANGKYSIWYSPELEQNISKD